jgi:molybdenum cofactor biosynthesis enzyme MoaA
MVVDRSVLYRLPWSRTDNAGAWIEVTDACDFRCPGCYRHRIAGHRDLDELRGEVLELRRLTNCDRIAIAGGEPLLYSGTPDIIRFIAQHGMKPILLTNGERLTPELGRELQRAGLAKFHFHVDSGMQRPGWEHRTEAEMNELRQHFADLVHELAGVQCGFNITVFPSTLHHLPDVLDWARRNIHKVHHLSLIAFRSIPMHAAVEYRVGGAPVDVARLQHATADLEQLTLTTERMLEVIRQRDPAFRPCTYLPGTAVPSSHKFLAAIQVGTAHERLGWLGPRSVEAVQVTHHFLTGRYAEFLHTRWSGRKLLILGLVDAEVRSVARRLVRCLLRRPVHAFARLHMQSISLQQPNEMAGDEANLCDGCLNMMLYRGELIPSCRLDEYRIFGGPLVPLHAGRREGGGTATLDPRPDTTSDGR